MNTLVYSKVSQKIIFDYVGGWNVTTAVNYARAAFECKGGNILDVYFVVLDNQKHTASRTYHFVDGRRQVYKPRQ